MSEACLVCELPVSDQESHIVLTRVGSEPTPVHERCLKLIRRPGPWPEQGRVARLSR
jgi:hypothetical protein